jgi:putative ABC transport system permease protein
MMNNRWMMVSLLIGSVLVIAMTGMVPIYTNGVLQRMLTKDLESFQKESDYFPGHYKISASFGSFLIAGGDMTTGELYKSLATRLNPEEISDYLGVLILAEYQYLSRGYLTMHPEYMDTEDAPMERISISALGNLQDHIEVSVGEYPSGEINEDGIMEVIVPYAVFISRGYILGDVYAVNDVLDSIKPIRAKVVGAFNVKDMNDPYWEKQPSYYSKNLFIPVEQFKDYFLTGERIKYLDAAWLYAFDYQSITIKNLDQVVTSHQNLQRFLSQYNIRTFSFPAFGVLKQYMIREQQLKITLWVLNTPVLLMLAFYIFMISYLIVQHEQNEIAVMKSRGKTTGQVFLIYFVESVIIGLVGLAAGPPLGYFFSAVLGASNGFLEFVQRTALPLNLSWEAYFYSALAFFAFLLFMLLPAYLSSRTTIVIHKRKQSRRSSAPLWKKLFLDIILLGIAGYGYYQFQEREHSLASTGAAGLEVVMDPLLYLVSTTFILGAGLFFLRIYPYLIKFIFWLGRKVWSPVFYASLIQVGRSEKRYHFFMLFIMLTLAIGIYNANSARTFNTNMAERIRYDIGADITVREHWEGEESPFAEEESQMEGYIPQTNTGYVEPPFYRFTEIPGVETATKVLHLTGSGNVIDMAGVRERGLTIMGIVPHEFGQVAWFRNDLLPYHWYNYLNLLARSPNAVLLSSTLQSKYNISVGDTVWITWDDQRPIEGKVNAFVNYWPSIIPLNIDKVKRKHFLTINPLSIDKVNGKHFLIGNYSYFNSKMSPEPYTVWIDKSPDVSSARIYDELLKAGVDIKTLENAEQEIIKKKNDPMLQGTNGAMTMSFVITLAISIIGFLTYWIISIKDRLLQFGIFRATGLSTGKVIGMLITEQVLVSGVAVVLGIVIGGIASYLFVPLLGAVFSTAEQILPFEVIAYWSDYLKVYGFVGFMLIAGLAVLSGIVSRIRIHQVIKLGEE